MDSLKKRVILVGKGASGKDHLRKMLTDVGLKYCVSHTTRPPRSGEKEGEDYYFIGTQEAKSMIDRGLFVEYTEFNGWIYGTSLPEFNSSDLFIMTPSGLSKISKKDRSESLVVFLEISEEIRRERMSKRRDADDVDRRIIADELDFSDFKDYDYLISEPFFTNLPNFLMDFKNKNQEV